MCLVDKIKIKMLWQPTVDHIVNGEPTKDESSNQIYDNLRPWYIQYVSKDWTNKSPLIHTNNYEFTFIYTGWTNKYATRHINKANRIHTDLYKMDKQIWIHSTLYRIQGDSHKCPHITKSKILRSTHYLHQQLFPTSKHLTDLSHTVLYRENPQLMDFQIMAHSSLRITL